MDTARAVMAGAGLILLAKYLKQRDPMQFNHTEFQGADHHVESHIADQPWSIDTTHVGAENQGRSDSSGTAYHSTKPTEITVGLQNRRRLSGMPQHGERTFL